MTDPRSAEQEALAQYLARMRSRLPGTAATMGAIAENALSMQDARVEPERFAEEFSGIIRSLQALGVSMDSASKKLAASEVEGRDASGTVRITSTATMADIRVHLSAHALTQSSGALEGAIAAALTDLLRACRDLTVSTVDSASTRIRHHVPRSD